MCPVSPEKQVLRVVGMADITNKMVVVLTHILTVIDHETAKAGKRFEHLLRLANPKTWSTQVI